MSCVIIFVESLACLMLINGCGINLIVNLTPDICLIHVLQILFKTNQSCLQWRIQDFPEGGTNPQEGEGADLFFGQLFSKKKNTQ